MLMTLKLIVNLLNSNQTLVMHYPQQQQQQHHVYYPLAETGQMKYL
jgi:hypothetical protein